MRRHSFPMMALVTLALVLAACGGQQASPSEGADESQAPGESAAESEGTATGGTVEDIHVTQNPAINGWRLGFHLQAESQQPIEMRAYLKDGDDVLTETWSYSFTPGP